MDWIRKNTFLASFLGVLLVAAGGLGYLLYSQMGTYDQTSQEYDAAVKELDRLQNTKPYPYQKSKAELVALSKATSARVSDLQKRLADYDPPAERSDFKPVEFQDKLRQVVDQITQAARAAKVDLPADFYMGFEQYRGTPPDAAAAPALSRELDAISDLMRILINRHIDKLISIKRAPLPQEPGGAALSQPAAPRSAGPARPGATPAALADSVSRHPVDIAFSGQPSAFRDTLDDMVTSKRLFLVRAIQVKNQTPKGPPRELAGAVNVPPPPPVGTPDPSGAAPPPAPPDKPPITYIVGLEKLDVDMRVEIIKVAPPDAAAAR